MTLPLSSGPSSVTVRHNPTLDHIHALVSASHAGDGLAEELRFHLQLPGGILVADEDFAHCDALRRPHLCCCP